MSSKSINLKLTKQLSLKYGTNPHQEYSEIFSSNDSKLPFKILNGNLGYINLLDALNSQQLVSELSKSLNLAAAASFKHVSPAGAAVAAVKLSEKMRNVYEISPDKQLTPSALAYVRARNADPKSSYGDFAALSERVDKETALFIKTCVSDGIIAPDYDSDALEILKAKKNGKYIVLQANPNFIPEEIEYRQVFGVFLAQERNKALIDEKSFTKIVTNNKNLSDEAKRDLILAATTLKYTQSNSVGFAKDGQMIGIGAGQQSRVDCVKLAGGKSALQYLRQHPNVLNLKFKKETRKVDRLNARIKFIEGDFTKFEYEAQIKNFEKENIPSLMTFEEKQNFLKTLSNVSLSSDAFFPFRDNIDHAAKYGVTQIIQPGGSVQDESVIKACDEYGMVMAFNGIRLFHH